MLFFYLTMTIQEEDVLTLKNKNDFEWHIIAVFQRQTIGQ